MLRYIIIKMDYDMDDESNNSIIHNEKIDKIKYYIKNNNMYKLIYNGDTIEKIAREILASNDGNFKETILFLRDNKEKFIAMYSLIYKQSVLNNRYNVKI